MPRKQLKLGHEINVRVKLINDSQVALTVCDLTTQEVFYQLVTFRVGAASLAREVARRESDEVEIESSEEE